MRRRPFTLATLVLLVGCSSSSAEVVGDCTPRSGAGAGPFYTFAELPSGACTAANDCRIGIYGPCGGDPNYVGYPYDSYRCTCANARWSCALEVQGAGVCANGGDGGADGASD